MTRNTTLTERAKDFAHRAHDSIGQKRKYTGEPYWVHTDEVAETVAAAGGGSSRMVAAAHLHDVLEDVAGLRDADHPFGIEAIKREFGPEVLSLVMHLTDLFTTERLPHMNRARRKALENARMTFVPNEAKTIKLADIISNTRDIVSSDPNFAKLYLREKAVLLKVLGDGDRKLYDRALA